MKNRPFGSVEAIQVALEAFVGAILFVISGCASTVQPEPQQSDKDEGRSVGSRKAPSSGETPATEQDGGSTTVTAEAVSALANAVSLPGTEGTVPEISSGEMGAGADKHEEKQRIVHSTSSNKKGPRLLGTPHSLIKGFTVRDEMLLVFPISAAEPVKRRDGLLQREVSFQVLQVLVGEQSDSEIRLFELVERHNQFMKIQEEQVVIIGTCSERGGQLRRVVFSFFYPTSHQLRLLVDLAKKHTPVPVEAIEGHAECTSATEPALMKYLDDVERQAFE